MRIGVLLGSTRPGRKSEAVGNWVYEHAKGRPGVNYEIIDLAEHDLPLLDERFPPGMGRYEHDHTKRWAEVIDSFDGFVIVTPEYNHSTSGVLKNAMDLVYAEWNNKAVGFVGYGSSGGVRAVEHLRLIAAELQMADVRAQVAMNIFTDWQDHREFTPADFHTDSLEAMFDQVEAWAGALRPLRAK